VSVAPQVGLLRRAALMINHAGTQSVKECLYFGVPMVGVPLLNDQPEIARLIEHHGVGRTLPPADVTSARLLALLDDMLGDPRYSAACAKMQGYFRTADAPGHAVATLEACVRRRAAQPTRAAAATA
jgi:UDP:flavonoid glycosyltransferase YjiC (YdhE family)